ncbi:hypothetical protein [Aeromicrobium sp. UC242_57]|uniref:hypothetical protein n=1 Tax=Aeromicrobium sp. UC242_57 TaxID=3374624 RepID=UPI003794F980
MSVSARINPFVAVGCLGAVTLVAVLALAGRDDETIVDRAAEAPAARTPAKAVDVIDSTTPARSASAISERLFPTSPVAVLVDRRGGVAQSIAIESAKTLRVPVLVDDASAPAELRRLKATTVLAFGRTRAVAGARAVPLEPDRAAAEVATLTPGPAVQPADLIVVTRSLKANAAAVATATNAGATVIEIPDADPRTSPAVARQLRDRATTPVIALGRPFVQGFAYSLDIVRRQIEQPTGGLLALPGKHYTAMYGHPGAPQLGVLGEQGVRASIKRVERLAAKYRRVSKPEFVPDVRDHRDGRLRGSGQGQELLDRGVRQDLEAAGRCR